MPPGGDGFYYFSIFLMVLDLEFAYFDMQINGETICTAYASQTDTPINDENTSCMAVSYVAQGIKPICFKHF